MRNKLQLNFCLLLAAVLFTSAAVSAQTGSKYKIERSVIAGGGSTSSAASGNTSSATGTVGQSASGVLSSSRTFSLKSGFWAAANGVTEVAIGGQILFNSTPLQNVTVSLTNSQTGAATITDSAGNFLFSNLTPGVDYTVTPTLSNYVFTPAAYTFSNVTTDQTANFTATQCSVSISPNGTSTPFGGGSASITVTTPSGCTWTASTTDAWITITSGANGNGGGTVSYSVAANDGAQRNGIITVAGQNFLITQAGVVSTISGTVSYGTTMAGNPAKFVSDVLMSVTGSQAFSVITNSSGAYSLENLMTGGNYIVTPSKSGNVNGITAFDATLVLRCVAEGENCTLTPNQRIAANTDANSEITSFDATLILRYVAGGRANADTENVGFWKFDQINRPYSNLAANQSGQNYTAFLIGEVDGDWTP